MAASQSKARMPSGVLELTKTRWRLVAANNGEAVAASVAAEAVIKKSRRVSFPMATAIVADGARRAPPLYAAAIAMGRKDCQMGRQRKPLVEREMPRRGGGNRA